jgi:uncharacterized HAD superfamily protein
MKEKPLPNRYCVDLDGTLSNTTFNEKTGHYDLGTPKEDVADAMGGLALNNEIVIFTARPKKEWTEVQEWLDANGIPFDRIRKKPKARAYIDDRAMRPDELVLWHKREQLR